MKTMQSPLLWFVGLLLLGACAQSTRDGDGSGLTPSTPEPAAPVAPRIPTERILHGDRFIDDYFWLRNKGTPEVESYLTAENRYADATLAPLKSLTDLLYREILSHVAEDDETVPAKDGGYWYWQRTQRGKDYPIYLRRRDRPGAPEEIVLDVNALAEGKAHMGIGTLSVSDDGQWLLYTTDDAGFRQYRLHLKNLSTGEVMNDLAEKVTMAVWSADAEALFYSVEDEAKRSYRVYRHERRAGAADELVYEEKDGRFDIYLSRTQSQNYVVLHSESKLSTEVRLIDAQQPRSNPILVEARAPDIKYYVEDWGDQWVMLANDKGPNFRLVSVNPNRLGKAHWRELLPHNPDLMLERLLPFKDFIALETRLNGVPRVHIYRAAIAGVHAVPMPETNFSVYLQDNHEFDSQRVRYEFESLSTPPSTFEYALETGHSTLLKERAVPGGFDRRRYRTEYLLARANDGTPIPISLVQRIDVPRDGGAPLFLQGYGSYGYSFPSEFDAARLVLLDRGVSFAIAHVRGGGEMGKRWHEGGRMDNKMNTFTDFVAATEYLIAQKYSAADRLAIEGGSAGGLLMGAVLNLRPDLFKVAVVKVPFVDVVNTMNDASLPLTISEYEEWGDPSIAEQYRWMLAYSPYENIAAKSYPTILVRSAYNDSQVMYWEPAKYVARLRALKTDHNPLLFKIHMEPAGHGGKSGRYEHYREVAEDYAFLLWQLGVGKPAAASN